jgi:hypothetical protein
MAARALFQPIAEVAELEDNFSTPQTSADLPPRAGLSALQTLDIIFAFGSFGDAIRILMVHNFVLMFDPCNPFKRSQLWL